MSPLTKRSVPGKGEASASPRPRAKKTKTEEAKPVAKTKVRVLYATAFTGAGIEVWHIERDKRGRVVAEMPLEVVEVDRKLADALIQAGHAEAVK